MTPEEFSNLCNEITSKILTLVQDETAYLDRPVGVAITLVAASILARHYEMPLANLHQVLDHSYYAMDLQTAAGHA